MASVDIINLVLKATDKASGEIQKASNGMSGFTKAAVALGAAGTAAVAAVGVGLKASVDSAAEFEKAFANVTTLFDTGRVSTEQMKQEILALDPALGSAKELTEGLYQAISAGREPAEAVKFVGEAAKFAKAGLTDTFTAVDVLTTALNTYKASGLDAAQASDILFKTIEQGKTTGDELAGSIGRVLPVASSMGVSFAEVNASIATMTAGGLKTSEAVTSLKAALSNILKPSKEATELAAELGIQFDAGAVKTMGWKGFLEQFGDTSGITSDQMATLFGSIEGLNGILQLAGEQSEVFNEKLAIIEGGVGATDAAFKKQQDTFAASMETLSNTFEQIKIAVGTELLPVLKPYIDSLSKIIIANKDIIATKFSEFLENLAPIVQTAVTWFTALSDKLSAIWNTGVLQDLITMFSKLGKVLEKHIGEVIEDLSPIVTAVRSIITTLNKNHDNMFEAGVDILVALGKGIASAVTNVLIRAVQQVTEAIFDIVAWVRDHAWEFIDAGKRILQSVIDGITDVLGSSGKAAVRAVTELLGTVLTWIADSLARFVTAGKDLVVSLVSGLSEARGGGLESAISFITDTLGKILKWLIDNVGVITQRASSLVKSLASNITDGAKSTLEPAIASVISILDPMLDWFKSNEAALKNMGINTIALLSDTLQARAEKVLTLAVDYVTSQLDNVRDWYHDNQSAIGQVGPDTVNSIADSLQDPQDLIGTAIRSLLSGLMSYFPKDKLPASQGPLANMRDAAVDVLRQIKDGLSDSDIRGSIDISMSSLADAIVDGFNVAVITGGGFMTDPPAKAAGKNILRLIKKGVTDEDTVQDVKDSVEELAHAIVGAFTGVFVKPAGDDLIDGDTILGTNGIVNPETLATIREAIGDLFSATEIVSDIDTDKLAETFLEKLIQSMRDYGETISLKVGELFQTTIGVAIATVIGVKTTEALNAWLAKKRAIANTTPKTNILSVYDNDGTRWHIDAFDTYQIDRAGIPVTSGKGSAKTAQAPAGMSVNISFPNAIIGSAQDANDLADRIASIIESRMNMAILQA